MPEALEPLSIAIIHHGKGEIPKAAKIYEDILKENPENYVALNFLGLAAHQSEQLEDAVNLIQKSVEINPNYDAALGNLGNVLVALQRYEEAIPCYLQAIDINPNLPQLHNALGIALKANGRLVEAIESYDVALKIDPDFSEAHYNKGNALVSSEIFDGAIVSFECAIAINPYLKHAHNNLGLAYAELEKYADAVKVYLVGLRLDPQNDTMQFNLGNAKLKLGLIEDAIDCYREAIAANPNDANYYKNLGMAFKRQGVSSLAVVEFEKAIKVQPDLAYVYLLLANLLNNLNQPNKAIDICQDFLNLKFENPEDHRLDIAMIHNILGLLFVDLARMNEALKNFQMALKFDPESADVHSNYGTQLLSCGYIKEAIISFEAAIRLKPENFGMFSNKLYALSYCTGQSAKTLYPEHLEWEKRFAKKYQNNCPQHLNSRDPERQLRIGFVSPDLGHHPVGSLVLALLKNLSVQGIIVICYSSGVPDVKTDLFKAAASIWRDAYGQSDNVLANMIFSDEVDILIDLSGHTGENRLGVFASKPAPIQMSWAGYVSTTGLSAMDYILSDRYSILSHEEQYYQEKVVRMPDGWVCYSPPDDAPEAATCPCSQRGYITFASFSNPAKINEDVIKIWSKILSSVLGSRLLIKYNGANSDANSDRLLGGFRANGVDSSRVTLEGTSPHAKLLERYNDVDIALDTFPYSGGVTTFEALWMGVPVVTVPGKTFASRHSQSHLSTIGLTELIAKDRNEYVKLAVELADDIERLTDLSQNLRSMVAASPSCDGNRFAQDFTAVTRGIWREWCSH